MIQLIRELQGSEFITGILMLLVMVALWAMAWQIFGGSVLLAVLVCWMVAALIPFIARVVTLCLSSSCWSVLDN